MDILFFIPIIFVLSYFLPVAILAYRREFKNEYFIFLLISLFVFFLIDEYILGLVVFFGYAIIFFGMSYRWEWRGGGMVFLLAYLVAVVNFVHPIKSDYFLFSLGFLSFLIFLISIFFIKPRKNLIS